MIKIPIPDYIKSLLVDDWEEVTKNLALVPLPSQKPVNTILDEYFEEEKEKRFPGSADMDLLEEVVAGMKEYFDVALGRMLLYRFERQQYADVIKHWAGGKGEWKGKSCPGDTYGAEHLCRMLGTFFRSCKRQSQHMELNRSPQSTCPKSSPRPTWTPSPSTVSGKR